MTTTFSKGHLSSENPDHGHFKRKFSEGPVSDGRNSQLIHESWFLSLYPNQRGRELMFTFGSLRILSEMFSAQPVQLEKAISNPDLRAGKVRQRSVASAENTEVAGRLPGSVQCALCIEGGGCSFMMTAFHMTILSCHFGKQFMVL